MALGTAFAVLALCMLSIHYSSGPTELILKRGMDKVRGRGKTTRLTLDSHNAQCNGRMYDIPRATPAPPPTVTQNSPAASSAAPAAASTAAPAAAAPMAAPAAGDAPSPAAAEPLPDFAMSPADVPTYVAAAEHLRDVVAEEGTPAAEVRNSEDRQEEEKDDEDEVRIGIEEEHAHGEAPVVQGEHREDARVPLP